MTRMPEVWSPVRGMERFRKDFDELVDRFFGKGIGSNFDSEITPRIESFVEDGKFVIRADLPGIDPKDVEVTVRGDVLTLRGKREQHHENRDRDYFYREVSYGSFERTIELPEGIKADDVKAAYKNGVLEMTMTMPKEKTARKVKIEAENSGHKQVEHKA